MTVTAIFDANYLARRAFYSKTGELDNGTIFGFLRDMSAAVEYLQADTAAFCFDSIESKRLEACPDYKKSRRTRLKNLKPEEYKRETEFYRQMNLIPDILREIGYRNIFAQAGYEADDLIASCCGQFPGQKILVSADQDLWQLLRSSVSCWNPQQKKMVTARSFDRDWKIPAEDWVSVKAIAGCGTDDIRGVIGVGERTAAKWLRNEIGKDSGRSRDIADFVGDGDQYDLNRLLVRIPYPGTMICRPDRGDNPTVAGWARVARRLKMPLLVDLAAGIRRKRVTK